MSAIEWPGIVCIIFTVLALIIMGGDWAGPDLVFSTLLAFLMAFQNNIIPVSKAAAGYGNTGLLTVIFLYLVAEGVAQTGGFEYIMGYVLGRSRSPYWAIVRLTVPCMFISAFLNNTPVVSLMIPICLSFGRRCGVPVKKLLIPLAYATVLGGTCTLIGTSTNLVVSGLQTSRYAKKDADAARFNIFGIAPWGIPYAIWGWIFMCLTQRWLLPGNTSKFEKDLLIALSVLPKSPAIKKSILDSGLRHQQGVTLSVVMRKGALIRNPAPDFIIEEGDLLYFAGELDQVEYVGEEFGLGLVTAENEDSLKADVQAFESTSKSPYNKLLQATIAKNSELLGRAIRDVNFRRFRTVVVAIKRGNARQDGPLNDVVLAPGDVLIMDTEPLFDRVDPDFTANFEQDHFVKDGTAKEFVIGVLVRRGSDATGKTLSGAGLRGVPGLYIIALDRETGERIENIDHHVKIETGDTLWFAADIAAVTFLSKFNGLQLVQQDQIEKTKVKMIYRCFVQAAVAHKGPLVGQTLKNLRFRTRYNAAVVAVHREGTRIPLRIQDIELAAGDVLLISAGPKWSEEHRYDKAFVLLQDVPDYSPPKKSRMIIGVALATAMVLTQVIAGIEETEYIHLWPCSILTAALMMMTGCMNGNQARKSIQWDVYLTIAAAFGVSAAMENTGVAKWFANLFIDIGDAIGSDGAALTAIYVATALLSEILTNNAAGAIMYPIAAIAGESLGLEPKQMSVAIMLGASAGFINPFSYQCNLMVYTAGNYKTLEFARIGVPFQLWLFLVAAVILFNMDAWHYIWIGSFIAAALIIALPAMWYLIPTRFTIKVELWWERLERDVVAFFARLVCWRRKPASPVVEVRGSSPIPTRMEMSDRQGQTSSPLYNANPLYTSLVDSGSGTVTINKSAKDDDFKV